MARKLKRKNSAQLHCEGDLDGYIFVDINHAREWLGQKFVDDTYEVSFVAV